MVIFTIVLVLIDQVIKIIMNTFFKGISFRLFNNNLIGIQVYLNPNVSAFSGIHIYGLALLNIIIFVVLISIYSYFKYLNITKKGYYLGLLFFIATCIASTIDRIFWGGSLDYIVFLGYIIDLKDIYLGIGVVIILYYVIKETSFDKRASMKDDFKYLKGYFIFIKKSLSNLK